MENIKMKKYIDNAKTHINILSKNPFITSIDIDKINIDTGGLIKEDLYNLMIGSVARADKTEKLIRLLEVFRNKYVNNNNTISIDRASYLIGRYGELLANEHIISDKPLTERALEWCNNNNYIPILRNSDFLKGDRVLSLKELLEERESLASFIKDYGLVDSVREMINKHPSNIPEESLYYLLNYFLSNFVNNDILKDFNDKVFSSRDKSHIALNSFLLDKIELGINPSIPYIAELIKSVKEKIEEAASI